MATLVRRAFGNNIARYSLAGALIAALAFIVLLVARAREQPTLVLEVQPLGDATQIRVYVGGAVRSPGLYDLPRGSRVAEALDAAGGVTDAADTSALGLAAPLEDADQIIVPSISVGTTITPPAAFVSQPTPAATTAAATGVPATSAAPSAVNVNTASASELEALPGIGPALAARIIEYRQTNGPFQSVDELAEIRGISVGMVETLRPLVTLGH